MTLYERPRAEQPPIWMGTDETDPGPGTYLVLRYHHDGESHWSSDEQIQARLEFILDGGKPSEEVGWRLAEMRVYRYSPELAAAVAPAQSAYDAAVAPARSAYDAAVRRAVRGLPHVSGAQWMEGQRP